MIYTPHDFQSVFLGDYIRYVDNDAEPGSMRLYTSPTGTGKSVMELMALDWDKSALLVTPRLEIVAGMLTKMGVEGVDQWSTERLAREALARRITTPVRLRNMLAKGSLQSNYDRDRLYAGTCNDPDFLPLIVHRIIFDEGHHLLADTYSDIRAYLPGAVIVCLTATGFRGTPKETDKFLDLFNGQINQVLSLHQAAARGLFTTPRPEIWPLVDDDTLEVVNGEIKVDSAAEAAGSVLMEVVERCRQLLGYAASFGHWDRPTMFAVPSTAICYQLAQALTDAGLPAEAVTQDTPRDLRNDIFRLTVERKIALVQIDVVSEGVDLPIRRLIDLRPTLSPVKWMQQLGRITRPFACPHCVSSVDDTAVSVMVNCQHCHGTRRGVAEYICTNRNLERHGYLLDGLFPPAAIALAQQVFGKPSKRTGMRVVGLEGIGRFQGTELPLIGGLTGTMYALTQIDGYTRRDYVILCHPCSSEPIVAYRESTVNEQQQRDWGKFRRVEKIPDLSGYASASSKSLSEKQKAWWGRDAARFGLDCQANVTRKNFQALPVLKDIGVALVGGNG